jgi:hypothetical protein
MSPIAIGLITGAVCYFAVSVKFRFKYDDALDVVGVHLVGGISVHCCSAAAAAVNSAGRDGVFLGGGWSLFGDRRHGRCDDRVLVRREPRADVGDLMVMPGGARHGRHREFRARHRRALAGYALAER